MSNTASRQATANPGAPGSTGQPGSSTSTGGRPAPSDFVAVRDLADIHFDFDKYTIRPTDADLLDQNARWLKANEKDLLLIEGHCDERGTNEYNLALGERRAKAAPRGPGCRRSAYHDHQLRRGAPAVHGPQ